MRNREGQGTPIVGQETGRGKQVASKIIATRRALGGIYTHQSEYNKSTPGFCGMRPSLWLSDVCQA